MTENTPPTEVNPYRSIMESALHYTTQKMRIKEQALTLQRLKQLDPTAHSYFRYGVAKEVLKYLHTVDKLIAGGYLLGEEEEREVPHRDPLYLIISVKRKTAALQSILEDAAQGLLREYKELMGEGTKELEDFALLQALDERDFQLQSRIWNPCLPPLKIEIL